MRAEAVVAAVATRESVCGAASQNTLTEEAVA